MVPLNPSHDIRHGLAIPLSHRRAIENQQATVANDERIRKAFSGLPTGEVATGSAMHPLLAIQRHPFGIIEQCHTTFAILVLFRNQLGGRFHFFEQWAHDAVGPHTEVGTQRLKVQLALEESGVEKTRHVEKEFGGLGCHCHFHRREC